MSNLNTTRFGAYCKALLKLVSAAFLVLLAGEAHAAITAATVAQSIIDTFTNIAKLIVATAYVAGLGFAIGAIMKFKQHKDNPTQIPIGTPVALLFVSAALVFLPTIFGVTGATLFGTAQVGGATGTLIGDI